MEEKKLRTAIYCRFSTAEQIGSSAMNAQSARLHEQARRGSLDIVRTLSSAPEKYPPLRVPTKITL
ncbi:hypothetical protein [Faecalibacterium duncaniae]|uniref:hypothetical protein n=1 Tax=Faecalibacterium duncaniae (strain DSM 17677 / JCM 31915 / A2-165) TaxID=411483 RepID=UPI003ED938A2